MMNIRLPSITAQTERGQLEQIRSYLYQVAQELNWAMDTIDRKADEATKKAEGSVGQKNAAEQAQATFADVKSLIIKSADIVNAYYEEISHRLEGVYVAQSDFGTYRQETSNTLTQTSESITALFENQQTIETDVKGLGEEVETFGGIVKQDGDGNTTVLGSEAWCKIGVLGYENGYPIYGMEIGQNDYEQERLVYKKFAQYRSDGVHLYDQNDIEVATVSDYKLKITNAEMNTATVTGSMTVGGYEVTTKNGLAFKWKGRG